MIGFYEFLGVILILGMILILLRGVVSACRKRKWDYIIASKLFDDCS